jgi:glycylpeptide N-tetradecanoyltransferase
MATENDFTLDKFIADAELSDEEGVDTEGISPTIEQNGQGEASGSTSNKKKKKKKSKVKKMLEALSSKNAVPQAVVEKVVEQVKEDGAPGSENIDAEDVRQVLQQIKIMDVLKGKAAIGGNNRKDAGEHKVCFPIMVEKLAP